MKFECPYCKTHSNLNVGFNEQMYEATFFIANPRICNKELKINHYICQNNNCNRSTIDITIENILESTRLIDKKMRIIPEYNAEIIEFPEYIPSVIRTDYREACLIKSLSPKASATLSRRCLQGIIRDFWNIKNKKNLFEEIDAISDKIDSLTKNAIDAVRSIGNIGAHMEKDINTIVDVDEDEAQLLIGLIEILIEEWYIMRHEREKRMIKLIQISEEKNIQKANNVSK